MVSKITILRIYHIILNSSNKKKMVTNRFNNFIILSRLDLFKRKNPSLLFI